MTDLVGRYWDLRRFAEPRTAGPTLLFLFNLACYAGFVFLAIWSTSTAAKLGWGVLAGLATTTLFIIGHDACHLSYTRSRRLNRIIGTIVFLPALHPYSLWEYGHNRLHHRFAAQIGLDYGYAPMTVDAYARAGLARRGYYRFMRSLVGQPFYYLVDIWLPKMFIPLSRQVGPFRRIYALDLAIVYTWLVLLLGGLAALQHSVAPLPWSEALVTAALFGFAVPFLTWNLFMSFVTIVQHTGPSLRWSLPTGGASSHEQQIHGTAQILFPEPLDWIFHRVMHHHAHHLQPGVPLYRLKAAQAEVVRESGDAAATIRWTPAYHWDLTKRCKLFDPETAAWRDFDFKPTTTSLPSATAVA